MGVDPRQANLRFLEAATEDPEWAREESRWLQEHNRERGAVYGGEPLPVTLTPKLVTHEQRDRLAAAARRLSSALETFVDAALEDPSLLPWTLDEELAELFQADPGYGQAVPVARYDGFLDGDELAILEFNTDSPAGPGYGDVVQEGFEALVERNPELAHDLELPGERRLGALGDTLLDCYREWRRNQAPDRPEDPLVVVADWRDVDSRADIDLVVDHLHERGLEARFADPRELQLDGEELVHEGERVDLVYKRVIVDELVAKPDTEPLAEAYLAGTVCMVNPPRSVLAGDKRVMALLASEPIRERLEPAEEAAVDRFVPWTRVLEPTKTTIEGYTVNLRDFVLDNREQLVLKAAVSYGGKDVALGPATDQQTWESLVDEHLGSGEWVVQELVDLPEGLFPRVGEDQVDLETLHVNVNPFVFGGSYAGCYTRVSADDVINVAAGGGIAATVTLDGGSRS